MYCNWPKSDNRPPSANISIWRVDLPFVCLRNILLEPTSSTSLVIDMSSTSFASHHL